MGVRASETAESANTGLLSAPRELALYGATRRRALSMRSAASSTVILGFEWRELASSGATTGRRTSSKGGSPYFVCKEMPA